MLGNFTSFCPLQLYFLKIYLSGIPSECQAVGIQIRADILSGLICVQTVFETEVFIRDIYQKHGNHTLTFVSFEWIPL